MGWLPNAHPAERVDCGGRAKMVNDGGREHQEHINLRLRRMTSDNQVKDLSSGHDFSHLLHFFEGHALELRHGGADCRVFPLLQFRLVVGVGFTITAAYCNQNFSHLS